MPVLHLRIILKYSPKGEGVIPFPQNYINPFVPFKLDVYKTAEKLTAPNITNT